MKFVLCTCRYIKLAYIDINLYLVVRDRLGGLVVRVLGYRSGFDSRHYQKKKVVGLERDALSLVSTN
jgi:hypothetical protein